MRFVLVCFFFLVYAPTAAAERPQFPLPESPDDIHVLQEPTILKSYYASLIGFPHMYSLAVEEPTQLKLDILIPDGEIVANDREIIVVKKEKRGVSEVARLFAKDADWSVFEDSRSGDTYRQGPVSELRLEPGQYLIEVSSPRNEGLYVLRVGYINPTVGYLTTIGDIYRVKRFLGKSIVTMVESPLVYWPLIFTLLAIIGGLYWKKRKYA